jgi:hypothetical protein
MTTPGRLSKWAASIYPTSLATKTKKAERFLYTRAVFHY